MEAMSTSLWKALSSTDQGLFSLLCCGVHTAQHLLVRDGCCLISSLPREVTPLQDRSRWGVGWIQKTNALGYSDKA